MELCETCGGEVTKHRNWGDAHRYCSMGCKSNAPRVGAVCAFCGEAFQVLQHLAGVRLYCSSSCRNKAYWQRKKVSPIMLSPPELAYLAGFIDGEGTVSIRRHKSKAHSGGYRYSPVVEINNTHVGVMDYFRRMFSGRRYNLSHKKTDNRKPCYRMSFNSSIQSWLLPAVLPYLVIKKTQCERVIEFHKLLGVGRYGEHSPELAKMEALYRDVHAMNHRGC